MSTGLKGFNENIATFAVSGDLLPGQAVAMADSMTVKQCAEGDLFVGVAVNVRKAVAGVQLTGYATLPYSGTAPTVGLVSLSADGKGGIKADDAGRLCLVTDVNTETKTAGILL